MKKRLYIIGVSILTALVLSATASAHSSYCGHSTKYFQIGASSYKEAYYQGWGAGPHYHTYYTYVWQGYWAYVHTHSQRQCPSHPV